MTAEREVGSRIAALDGARGVAALAVMAVHFTFDRFPANASLAVDLFFMLSGFVLAATYEGRFRKGMTGVEFIRARLARLYPVYLLGCAGGLLVALYDGNPTALLAFCANAVFIPFSRAAAYHGVVWLDGPLWSLSFEMIVNVAFAAGLWRLSNRWLSLLAALAGAVLLATIITTHSIGHTDPRLYLLGYARVFFGFPLGWLIWRLRDALKPLGAVIGWKVALAAICVSFFFSGPLAIGASVFLIYPVAMVGLAYGGKPAGRAERLMCLAGALSYPLYATHAVVANMLLRLLHGVMGAVPTLAAAAVVAFALAWLVHRTIEPMGRRGVLWLGELGRAVLEGQAARG